MSNKKPKILKPLLEYLLLGIKALLAFSAVLFKTLNIFYAYFVLDIVTTFYGKYQADIDRNLSTEDFGKLKDSSDKLQKKFDKMAKSQEKYEKEREIKENSLKLLNKLIAEGLIREKDLLSFTSKSDYFQLFVYSASLNKIARPIVKRPFS
ncbi:MAG: hypothetical protein ABFQ62_00980 [Patescibacteria group bacterium]